MAYYTDLFSPETYKSFGESSRDISGFRDTQLSMASRLKPGDRFLCYMTKLSRWVGVLEVESNHFVDDSARFYPENDPFIVRFKVKPLVWLPKDKCVPIHAPEIWNNLSFTKDCPPNSSQWTGKVRRSLNKMSDEDGSFLVEFLTKQASDNCQSYPIDDDEFRKLTAQRIRRDDKVVTVTVPTDDNGNLSPESSDVQPIRESCHVQALLAKCGETMGFKIWIPKNDRGRVLQEWKPVNGSLLEVLPLNYDDTTIQTIENIDVLWMRGRSMYRAFEVEHTTAIYSGILRMADLLALQPNMDIRLHLVAPESRKQKVFDEIQRPVFSLLERMPLSERCTFISYDSVEELSNLQHLSHLSDSVLDDFAELAE